MAQHCQAPEFCDVFSCFLMVANSFLRYRNTPTFRIGRGWKWGPLLLSFFLLEKQIHPRTPTHYPFAYILLPQTVTYGLS